MSIYGEKLGDNGGYIPPDDADNDVPFHSPEEYLDNLEVAISTTTMTAKDVEDTAFRNIPANMTPENPEENTLLLVHSIKSNENDENGIPVPRIIEVYVADDQGRPKISGYPAFMLQVNLCLPDKPSWRVQDFFHVLAPSATPSQHYAFTTGVNPTKPENLKNSNSMGFQYRKTMQFLARIGFTRNEAGTFEPAAYWPKNWKGRLVLAEIVSQPPPPKPRTDNEGNVIPHDPKRTQVKMFGYREYVDPSAKPMEAKTSEPAVKPAAKGKKK